MEQQQKLWTIRRLNGKSLSFWLLYSECTQEVFCWVPLCLDSFLMVTWTAATQFHCLHFLLLESGDSTIVSIPSCMPGNQRNFAPALKGDWELNRQEHKGLSSHAFVSKMHWRQWKQICLKWRTFHRATTFTVHRFLTCLVLYAFSTLRCNKHFDRIKLSNLTQESAISENAFNP